MTRKIVFTAIAAYIVSVVALSAPAMACNWHPGAVAPPVYVPDCEYRTFKTPNGWETRWMCY